MTVRLAEAEQDHQDRHERRERRADEDVDPHAEKPVGGFGAAHQDAERHADARWRAPCRSRRTRKVLDRAVQKRPCRTVRPWRRAPRSAAAGGRRGPAGRRSPRARPDQERGHHRHLVTEHLHGGPQSTNAAAPARSPRPYRGSAGRGGSRRGCAARSTFGSMIREHAARAAREHDDLVGQVDRLLDAVRHEHEGLALALAQPQGGLPGTCGGSARRRPRTARRGGARRR